MHNSTTTPNLSGSTLHLEVQTAGSDDGALNVGNLYVSATSIRWALKDT